MSWRGDLRGDRPSPAHSNISCASPRFIPVILFKRKKTLMVIKYYSFNTLTVLNFFVPGYDDTGLEICYILIAFLRVPTSHSVPWERVLF